VGRALRWVGPLFTAAGAEVAEISSGIAGVPPVPIAISRRDLS